MKTSSYPFCVNDPAQTCAHAGREWNLCVHLKATSLPAFVNDPEHAQVLAERKPAADPGDDLAAFKAEIQALEGKAGEGASEAEGMRAQTQLCVCLYVRARVRVWKSGQGTGHDIQGNPVGQNRAFLGRELFWGAVDDKGKSGAETPEELEFEDDDGTKYVWDRSQRKYMPKTKPVNKGDLTNMRGIAW
eukprot:1157013-Pelagomonas_calceolata.AAC.13